MVNIVSPSAKPRTVSRGDILEYRENIENHMAMMLRGSFTRGSSLITPVIRHSGRHNTIARVSGSFFISDRWTAFRIYPEQKSLGHEICGYLENNLRQ